MSEPTAIPVLCGRSPAHFSEAIHMSETLPSRTYNSRRPTKEDRVFTGERWGMSSRVISPPPLKWIITSNIYYPLQTLQAFVVSISLARLGLANGNAMSMSLDTSARLIEHIQDAREKAAMCCRATRDGRGPPNPSLTGRRLEIIQ